MGGCPEGIVQHGLYKVLPANVGVFFRENYPTRVIQGATATVDGCRKKISSTVLAFRVEHFTWSWESFEGISWRGGYLESVWWVQKGMF